MLLSELINSFKNELDIYSFKDILVNNIQTNSNLIKTNDIFFAIDGIKSKGIDYVDDAIINGAKVIFCDKTKNYMNDNVTVIKCNDVVKILGKILNVFYKNIPQNIIGITGTSGKTSIAEFTRQALELLNISSASIGTLGVNFKDSHYKEDTLTMRETVDLYQKLSFLKEKKNIDFVAMEFTSQGLDQRRAIGIHPKIGVFNNITPEHLDYHHNMEDYFNKKMLLFTDVLEKNSIAIINADILETQTIKDVCKKYNHKVLTFGYNGDIKIINIEKHFQGQIVNFTYLDEKYTLSTNFIGEFQVMNLLATFGIIVSLNIERDLNKIIKVLEKVKNADGRMEFVGNKKNGASIYIDYAHKPDALKKVLETMREHISNIDGARLCVLFGCGGDRDRTKRPIMGKIANDLADVVYITDDNPRTENAESIRNEIFVACPKAYNIANREIAIKQAINDLKEKDLLILAGKGHEKYTIIGNKTIPFDEFKIVQKCIS